jgi:hypothetical protein
VNTSVIRIDLTGNAIDDFNCASVDKVIARNQHLRSLFLFYARQMLLSLMCDDSCGAVSSYLFESGDTNGIVAPNNIEKIRAEFADVKVRRLKMSAKAAVVAASLKRQREQHAAHAATKAAKKVAKAAAVAAAEELAREQRTAKKSAEKAAKAAALAARTAAELETKRIKKRRGYAPPLSAMHRRRLRQRRRRKRYMSVAKQHWRIKRRRQRNVRPRRQQ